MKTCETPPVVALVGTEYEENLSLRYLAAALARAGLRAEIVPLEDGRSPVDLARRILALVPSVVGISLPFQARARELLAVADALRGLGYRGHVCLGGHLATFEYENLLRDFPSVDSVVRHHEGEGTFRELCAAVRDGAGPGPIPGLVVRGTDGPLVGPKRLVPRLDDLPWPDRPDVPHEVLGVATAPIIGSRGCYADCSFCCIYAYAENARGPRYRRRAPEDVAAEMRRERERRGIRLFVFHDDQSNPLSFEGRGPRCVGTDRDITLGDFSARYLEAAATTIKPATLESYTWAMEKHALPILGDLRVRELARAHVKAPASALVAKLSKKSAAIILGTLHACLEEAVDEEIVSVNVAARRWL